jgi:hypothetical protein
VNTLIGEVGQCDVCRHFGSPFDIKEPLGTWVSDGSYALTPITLRVRMCFVNKAFAYFFQFVLMRIKRLASLYVTALDWADSPGSRPNR